MSIKIFVVLLAIFYVFGCTSNSPTQNANSPNAPMRAEKLQNSTVHTTENEPPSNSASKWTQSGDPIDTSKFDKAIADADKAMNAESTDDTKNALAQAYFDRAFALTQARQYASAIGDYRRALKYDPEHAESKEWIEQIVSIYAMLKKSPPKEGEEPRPLPFKKKAGAS
jgi:tetratricopeptide (TPR) repeat protein